MTRDLNDGHGGGGETRPGPLSAEMVDAIARIEPPPARPDFWDRLDSAVGAGPVPLHHPTRRSRYRATLVAVAAATCVGAAGLWMATRGADSSVEVDDSTPVATGPERPVVSPTPTTLPAPSRELVADDTVADVGGADGAAATGGGPADPAAGATTTTTPAATTTSSASGSTAATLGGPVRLEAEDADLATYGGATNEGWQLWGNGYVEHRVAIPPGDYRITVLAQGVSQTGLTEPEMELRIDGTPVGSTLVGLADYRLYTFPVTVGGDGATRLAVAFTNDPNRQGDDVDLKIDYTEIAPAG